MKKNLTRAVILGVLCASVFNGDVSAEGFVISSDGNTYISQKSIIASEEDAALDIIGSNINGEKNIIFLQDETTEIKLVDRNTIGLRNSEYGKTIINGYGLDFNSNTKIVDVEDEYQAINNKGDLTFNTFVRVDSGYNNEFRNINIKVINQNNGILTFNNGFSISGDSSFIENNGIININKASKIDQFVYNAIDADITNNGEMNIDASGLYFYGEIDNKGKIVINSKSMDEPMYLKSYIRHSPGSEIDIYVKGVPGTDDFGNKVMLLSIFEGYIHYEGGDSCKLVIDEGGTWITEGNASDAVYGVELNNGGVISLAGNSDKYWNPHDNWGNSANGNILYLSDFKSNGNWETGGGFIVYTDLANDIGDEVRFRGNPCKVDVPFLIINKDDHNGVPITPNDGKSVTIASASYYVDNQYLDPNSGVDVKAEWMYGGSNKVYKPIIESVVEKSEFDNGSTKKWNFIGWEDFVVDRDITTQFADEAYLNTIEVDNTLKRLNDLRTDPSEVGVWIRGETGETQIRNYKYDYNLMSGGYDWHTENDNGKFFYGFGLSYSTNQCDDKVIGDTKSFGYNLYGSWLGKKNNDYVDLVVKFGKLDKNYAGYDNNNVFVSADYDKSLFSIATKYGRRIEGKDGWYYEPSVGYTYGKTDSADFIDNQNTRIHADSTNSQIASLGIQVGKNIHETEYYAKVEMKHDFDGKIRVSAPGITAVDDMGGTWYRCAIGAARKINDNNSFYIDIEKDFGNKVKKPYAFSLGYRYSW